MLDDGPSRESTVGRRRQPPAPQRERRSIVVEAAARRTVHAVRESHEPYFLECHTYRLRAHSMFDAQLYRDKAEVESWRHKDPIVRFREWLAASQMIHPDDLARIDSEVSSEITEAVAFAEAGAFEPVEQLARFTYAEPPG